MPQRGCFEPNVFSLIFGPASGPNDAPSPDAVAETSDAAVVEKPKARVKKKKKSRRRIRQDLSIFRGKVPSAADDRQEDESLGGSMGIPVEESARQRRQEFLVQQARKKQEEQDKLAKMNEQFRSFTRQPRS